MTRPRHILSVVPDLFFATRIAAVAEAVGATLTAVEPGAALAAAQADPPDLLVLDLHAPDPFALVRALRADATLQGIPVVGFYSHVDAAIRDAALAAGVNDVLPRSAFTRRLPELLHGGPLEAS